MIDFSDFLQKSNKKGALTHYDSASRKNDWTRVREKKAPLLTNREKTVFREKKIRRDKKQNYEEKKLVGHGLF